jgi:hypothetical protein
VLATLKELKLATSNALFFFRFFIISTARVNAVVIVLSDSPCEGIGKWEACPILKEDSSLVRV